MGLIKAALGAVGGNLADQWKEFFYCEAIEKDTLVVKGQKKQGKRTSNTHGEDNIITNGSGIAVADGQAMIIVEQGKVVEFCAEPGTFTYDTSLSPSIFTGDLGEGIKATFQNIGKRFTMGGDTGVDQRVYYFNTKEIMGNKYGTPNPVPYRVVDEKVGLDLDIAITCFGEYSYKITDPMLFYTNVCGNVSSEYKRNEIDSQLKTELLTHLQEAFAKISEMGIRYSALPGHASDIGKALNEVLSSEWKEKRGIEIFSFGVSSVKASEEDENRIKNAQLAGTYSNPALGAGFTTQAMGQAMMDAAKNEGGMGAMGAFMGVGMAGNMGGGMASNLYNIAAQQQAQQAPAPQAAPAGGWTCSCGTVNTGNFCSQCGQPKPAPATWTCACGTVNTGNFCSQCGKPRA